MLLGPGGMLLAELTGMLSRPGSMLPIPEGMLLLAGMLPVGVLLTEVAGMLRKLLSVLLALPSVLLVLASMLPPF